MKELIQEGVSSKGRQVRLLRECNSYEGAKPFYTVGVLIGGKKLHLHPVRYTPFKDRADYLFARFMEDATDPIKLRGPLSTEPAALRAAAALPGGLRGAGYVLALPEPSESSDPAPSENTTTCSSGRPKGATTGASFRRTPTSRRRRAAEGE